MNFSQDMTTMKVLYLCATYFEARTFIQYHSLQKQNKNFYAAQDKGLLITGIGRINVLKSLPTVKAIKPDLAINAGICCGLKGLELYEIFKPDALCHETMLLKSNIMTESLLLTVDNPITDSEEFLYSHPALPCIKTCAADMESSFLSAGLENSGIPLQCIRIVSDTGTGDFTRYFTERKAVLLEKFLQVAKSQHF